MGKTDLENLMLNRWFEKTVQKDQLWHFVLTKL